MALAVDGYDESSDEAEPLVAAGTATSVSCTSVRRAVKAAALTLAAGSVVCAVLGPAALQFHRHPRDLTAASGAAVEAALGLVAEGSASEGPAERGASNIAAAAPSAAPANASDASSVARATAAPASTTPEVCTDTPGWTNGYTACNNYNPVDPDCTKEGVTCHFYQRKPKFCQKGMNNPWEHCCACGGGSTFSGSAPTTTEAMLHLPHIPGMPHHLMRHMHMPKWSKKLSHSVSHELGSLEHKMSEEMKPVENAVGEVYDGLNQPDYNQYPELGGNSVDDINSNALRVFCGVAGVTFLGFCLDPFFARCWTPGRPKLWSLGLLFASYGLLVPGLSNVVLSFDIIANIVGHRVNIQPDVTQDTCTESVYGLIKLLYDTGSTVGAVMIFFYAIVVPAAKLLLLATGELLRFSTSRCGVLVARTCILTVQHISKWASPDMFAYIMLVHLIRDLDNFPLILTAGRLDEGFTCFSIFCVCSTISSLGIGVPKWPVEENEDEVKRLRQPLLLCLAGRGGAVAFVVFLSIVFAVLFGIGLHRPCMSLRIDEGRLYPPRGPVPYSAKPVVEALSIPDLLNSDISLWKCMVFLAGEITSGEANSVFALALWAIFVVAFTVIDMILLVLAALRLRWPAGTFAGKDKDQACCGPRMLRPCPFMTIARVLRKLSMLDVAIMGVLVMCYSLQMYAKDGIIIRWRQGLLVLAAAEAVHTVTFFLVSGAVEHVINQDFLIAEAEEPDMPSRCRPKFGACGCTRSRWAAAAEDRDDDPSVPNQKFSLSCCSANKRPHAAEAGSLVYAKRTFG